MRGGWLLAALGLTGFAVSQPLLSVAGENPTLFTFAGVGGTGLVVFALVVALVPALVVWALPTGVALVSPRAGRAVFVALAGVLAGVTTIQIGKQAGIGRTSALVFAGAVVAIAFAAALHRWRWVDQWVRYTSPLPVIAVLAFLFVSPSGQLLQSPSSAPTGTAGPEATTPVVMIMLDELPLRSLLTADGDIDAVRYPNLAGLAEDSTWYRNYTVMATRTVESVPNKVSGLVPRHAEPIWTEHPDTIFSLLAPTHELNVSETVTQLCGYETCAASGGSETGGVGSALGDIVDVWFDRVAPRPTGSPDLGQFREDVVPLDTDPDRADRTDLSVDEEVRARPDRVTEFLDAIEAGGRPGFHYLHLLLPHQPWMHHPDGAVHRAPGVAPEEILRHLLSPGEPAWKVAVTKQKHVLQTQYTDRLVGEIFERLRETDLYDDALVVVTADHGISFRGDEIERNPVDDARLGDNVFVPLLVKAPGQRDGRVDDTNLMSVDLLPLIADEIGIDIPWAVDGGPPGDPAVEARGSRKELYDFGSGFVSQPLQGIDEFDVSLRPTGVGNLLADIAEDDSPIAGLVATVGAADLLGEQLDELDLDDDIVGEARVEELEHLVHPPTDRPVLGSLWGRLDVPHDAGLVVVEVNGNIVTAAPLDETAELNALLPPGVPDRAENEVRMAVVPDDGSDQAYEIDVVERASR